MDRVSLITAERVADLIRDQLGREMSLRLVDVLMADTPDFAEQPGLRQENGRFTARRRTRGTRTPRERGSSRGPLRGSGRRLEAPEA